MARQHQTKWRTYSLGRQTGVVVIVDPKLEELIEGPRFVLRVYYRGFSRSVDAEIQRAARMENMGSGFDFMKGERDLDYHYATRRSAMAAQARVKDLRVRNLRATVKPYVY
jgi:hypothetical protein